MKARIPYDDFAWEKSTDIYNAWPDHLLDEDIYNEIGMFLAENYRLLDHKDFTPFKIGGFNFSLLMTFTNNSGAIIRFPIPGAIMFPEEKVRNEVSIMRFIREKTADSIPISVPAVSCWGQKNRSPSNLAPFIIMEYVDHAGTMRDLLEIPGSRRTDDRPVLNPNLSMVRLENLYGKLANVVLSLSTLAFSRIGSLDFDKGQEVINRPLSYSMNEIVQLGTLPRSRLPNTAFEKASSYFETLAELHISHLVSQRNDCIDSADDCQRKFVARFLFRKLVRDPQLRKKWIRHETGLFPTWCDDFRPENVLVNKSEDIAAVVDWAFTYAAPVEFSHAPPWWLLLGKPDYWSKGLDDWCTQYEKRLQIFLKAMTGCEDAAIQLGQLVENQRISGPMRDSWESGDFWIMYAVRNNFAFDAIYWQKIDLRFFGPASCLDPDDIWKERLDLLEPEEKQYMEEYVDLKVKEMETRVLAWDPDENTLEYMAKIKRPDSPRSLSSEVL